MTSPVWSDPRVMEWSRWLLDSYHHWTGRGLIDENEDSRARALFEAQCVVVSHGTEEDPVLNYGNQAALDLWETTWTGLVGTPSRLTAEPANQPERERMLEQARIQGFFEGYRGVRISARGRRFLVEQAVIWTVRNDTGATVGQAAAFSQWKFL